MGYAGGASELERGGRDCEDAWAKTFAEHTELLSWNAEGGIAKAWAFG